jgi:hypothetical protein
MLQPLPLKPTNTSAAAAPRCASPRFAALKAGATMTGKAGGRAIHPAVEEVLLTAEQISVRVEEVGR